MAKTPNDEIKVIMIQWQFSSLINNLSVSMIAYWVIIYYYSDNIEECSLFTHC